MYLQKPFWFDLDEQKQYKLAIESCSDMNGAPCTSFLSWISFHVHRNEIEKDAWNVKCVSC